LRRESMPDAPTDETGRGRRWGASQRQLAILVFAVAALLYSPSLANEFAYDDDVIVAGDSRLQDLSLAPRIFTQSYWPNPDVGLYRPLVSLSLAMDWAIVGSEPVWFHLVNLLWNAAACVLAFFALASFVPASAAVIGAMVFAVHPVHVEAVANIVGRAEVMAGFFCLAAFVIWLRAQPGRPLSWRRLAAVAACYALAVLSKESAIMLPALLVLLDAARAEFGPSNWRAWFRRHARAVAALGAIATAFLMVRSAVLGGVGPGVVDPLFEVAVAPDERIMTALQAWPQVLRLLLIPVTLLPDYGPPMIMPVTTLNGAAAAGGLLLGGLVVGGLVALHRGHGRLSCVLLFLPVALLPVSNLLMPIGVLVAERALYLPSFALALAVAFALPAMSQRHRRMAYVVSGIVVIAFSARTVHRIPAWETTATVFEALRRDSPESFRLHWYDARIAAQSQDTIRAMHHYADAIAIWPYRRQMVMEAIAYGSMNNRIGFARQMGDIAMDLWPDDVLFIRMNAGIRLDLGDVAGARSLISRGLSIAPGDSLLTAMHAAVADSPAQP
jgi:protein O-mannosyl-transferase